MNYWTVLKNPEAQLSHKYGILWLMKTTLEIPDPTFRKAKATAGALGIPLREFVTQAVEEKLSHGSKRQGKPWLECAGELAHLHKETLRIQKLIDEEFEQIEPED